MSIQLIRAEDWTKRAFLPFRLENQVKPGSLTEATAAKEARETVTLINKEVDRVESWVAWATSFDQSAQDLHPEPGKLAALGLEHKGRFVDSYVEFQSKASRQIHSEQPVSKAELRIDGKTHLEYSRNGDSVEVFVRQGSGDEGFLISGTYGRPATIRKEVRQGP